MLVVVDAVRHGARRSEVSRRSSATQLAKKERRLTKVPAPRRYAAARLFTAGFAALAAVVGVPGRSCSDVPRVRLLRSDAVRAIATQRYVVRRLQTVYRRFKLRPDPRSCPARSPASGLVTRFPPRRNAALAAKTAENVSSARFSIGERLLAIEMVAFGARPPPEIEAQAFTPVRP